MQDRPENPEVMSEDALNPLKHLTAAQFMALGGNAVVYVRPIKGEALSKLMVDGDDLQDEAEFQLVVSADGRRLLGAHRLLDPDSRARIEQTIDERKADRTVVVVARNMQQAASVSDFMAFMLLGRMIEFARRQTCFNRGRTNHEAIRYGQVR